MNTIRSDHCTTYHKRRIRKLSKNLYKYVYNIPNKIIEELPDYAVSDPGNRKRPRYAFLTHDEDKVFPSLQLHINNCLFCTCLLLKKH